jgi:hypothetical protein
MKTTSLDPQIVSFSATKDDGTVVNYRRCGHLPDLFADENGQLLRLQKASLFTVSGHPAVKYRNTSLSARTLVADAWLGGWKEKFDSIALVDGDRFNLHVVNLRPSTRGRGRPSGDSVITNKAEIYQLYKICPDVIAIAMELKVKSKEIVAALAEFDPELAEQAAGQAKVLQDPSGNG